LNIAKRFAVVVADRAHAYIYETSRSNGELLRVSTLENPNARLHERDLGSSAPGRSFNRSAGVHQTYQQKHSLQEQAVSRFARTIGRNVLHRLASKKYTGLVLIAAPRMLSQLRNALPRAVQAQVVLEIAKDLVHQPKRELVEQLRAA
jgi:protein required for attachment to host cells